jgi:hypothetical protein
LSHSFSRTCAPGATLPGATSPRPGLLGTGSLFPGAGLDARSSFRSSIESPWSQETRPLQPPCSKKGEKCADDFVTRSVSEGTGPAPCSSAAIVTRSVSEGTGPDPCSSAAIVARSVSEGTGPDPPSRTGWPLPGLSRRRDAECFRAAPNHDGTPPNPWHRPATTCRR